MHSYSGCCLEYDSAIKRTNPCNNLDGTQRCFAERETEASLKKYKGVGTAGLGEVNGEGKKET